MCSIIFVGLFPTLAHSVSLVRLFSTVHLASSLQSASLCIRRALFVFIFALSSWNARRDKPAFSSACRSPGQCKSHSDGECIFNKETRSRIKGGMSNATTNTKNTTINTIVRRNTSWNCIRIWKLASIAFLLAKWLNYFVANNHKLYAMNDYFRSPRFVPYLTIFYPLWISFVWSIYHRYSVTFLVIFFLLA